MAYQTRPGSLDGWLAHHFAHDTETLFHSYRVSRLAAQLAVAMGCMAHEVAAIRRGALLHDIGKQVVPPAILHKPGSLTIDEYARIKQHPQAGIDLLQTALLPGGELLAGCEIVYDIVLYHHERWNGSGYPAGLAETAIPFVARLCAVVDVWDALSNARTYRGAWSPQQVVQYMQQQAGTTLDPALVAALLRLMLPLA